MSGPRENSIVTAIDAAEEILDPLDGLIERAATDPGARNPVQCPRRAIGVIKLRTPTLTRRRRPVAAEIQTSPQARSCSPA